MRLMQSASEPGARCRLQAKLTSPLALIGWAQREGEGETHRPPGTTGAGRCLKRRSC
jgi:hypothetical protein